MKRVFIIHGWDGHPEEAWFPWLKKELEARNFQVFVPQLPDPENPTIENWLPEIKEVAKNPDEQTFFVGHSMGCQLIARYLEGLPENVKIGGVVFVAGFFKRLTGLTPAEVEQSDKWLKKPLDLKKVKTHFEKSVAIFSSNDPFVSLDNKDDFINIFKSETITEYNRGHFNEASGVKELPSVLKAVLEISGETG